MVALICGFLITLVGIAIAFYCNKKLQDSEHKEKVIGTVSQYAEESSQVKMLGGKKQASHDVVYRATYKIEIDGREYFHKDDETSYTPFAIGMEKEFCVNRDGKISFYNEQMYRKYFKYGMCYVAVGLIMIAIQCLL